MPTSILEKMLAVAADADLENMIRSRGIVKDRAWANEYAQDIYREMCRERLRLPTRDDLVNDDALRRKAAAIVSYVLAEGSIWLQRPEWGEHAANITFAEHETDLYEHFRSLCRDVFNYDIGPPQPPGNGAVAIRGFIYSRFVAEWLVENGVPVGDKSANSTHLPCWVMQSDDPETWISALQPWCDGEGHVHVSRGPGSPAFSISQSRHTDLDFETLPHKLGWRGRARGISPGVFRVAEVYGMPAMDYCMALFRSEVFDDVRKLFVRLGFSPRLRLHSMYLKEDGFWSCAWILYFPSAEAARFLGPGIVTQRRKVDGLARRRK
jgi:hypothetical protein